MWHGRWGIPPENLSYNLNRLQSAMILVREDLT
jgi:hypothetical protein